MLKYYIHRRNMEVKTGYNLGKLINEKSDTLSEPEKCNGFGTFIEEEDGRKRNYPTPFYEAEIGDIVILEHKNPETSQREIWGYTTVEERIDCNGRERLVFSLKKLRKVRAIDIKKLDFKLPQSYTFKALKDGEIEEIKKVLGNDLYL